LPSVTAGAFGKRAQRTSARAFFGNARHHLVGVFGQLAAERHVQRRPLPVAGPRFEMAQLDVADAEFAWPSFGRMVEQRLLRHVRGRRAHRRRPRMAH
jgi:hypothetical protein